MIRNKNILLTSCVFLLFMFLAANLSGGDSCFQECFFFVYDHLNLIGRSSEISSKPGLFWLKIK